MIKLLFLQCRDKLEDDQEFEIVGDVAELQVKMEASAKSKDTDNTATNGANGDAAVSEIGEY